MDWRYSSAVEYLPGMHEAVGSIHRSAEKQASFSFSFCVNFPWVLWPAWLVRPQLNGRDRLLDWQVHHYHSGWGAFTNKWLWNKTNKQQLYLSLATWEPQLPEGDLVATATRYANWSTGFSICRTANWSLERWCIDVCVQSWLLSKRVQAQVRGVGSTRLISHGNILPYEFSEINGYKAQRIW